jgi:hypothetical protein
MVLMELLMMTMEGRKELVVVLVTVLMVATLMETNDGNQPTSTTVETWTHYHFERPFITAFLCLSNRVSLFIQTNKLVRALTHSFVIVYIQDYGLSDEYG